MYEYRNLENVCIEDLAETWNLAFSDYIVDMDMSPERLEAYFKISGVDYKRSFGAFNNGVLVGMLMNSVDIYKGRKVAYDAMTGIAPEHRGKGLFSALFEYTKKVLKEDGITHYYLEVIQTNERAYNIYSAKGGKVEREYTFLKGRADRDPVYQSEIKFRPLSDFSGGELCDYEPSFSNRVSSMRRNADDYKVAILETEKGKMSVVINTQGRITQAGYDGPEGKTLLGAILFNLSQDFDELEISNIPATETELITELKSIGFVVKVDQYEMCIKL